jgi:chemotaxis protein MotB
MMMTRCFRSPWAAAGLSLVLSTGCVGAKKYEQLEDAYADAQRRIQSLEQDANALADATAELSADKAGLQADNAMLEEALRKLKADNELADARIAAYQDLTARFADMIDAGQLQVKIVDGRMVVELASDILFPSGSAQLSEEGRATLEQAGAILAEVERDFQVEGHTDDDPISTARFPSNWELAAGRAITVVRTLSDAGVQLDKLSAASFADMRPVASNDSDDGKALNRRIEIVVLPDLSTLPGADRLDALAEAE